MGAILMDRSTNAGWRVGCKLELGTVHGLSRMIQNKGGGIEKEIDICES